MDDINFDLAQAIDESNQSGKDLKSLLSCIKDSVRRAADILPHAAYIYLLNVLQRRAEKTLFHICASNQASAIVSAEARYVAEIDTIGMENAADVMEHLLGNSDACESCDEKDDCEAYSRHILEVN